MKDKDGSKQLLLHTNIDIIEGNIYGLVGRNGYGKSTLLRKFYEYEIEEFPSHIRMCFVTQQEIVDDRTILQSVLEADDISHQIDTHIDRLSDLLCDPECSDDDREEIGRVVELLVEIGHEHNSSASEAKAMHILSGLGFTRDHCDEQVSKQSGGWEMRCKLAQALFVEPDLMLLDEPTNHLDFPTVIWLQEYLKNYKMEKGKTVIVVSHDRTFLNEVCDHTILLNNHRLTNYRGNYDDMIRTIGFEQQTRSKEYNSLVRAIDEKKRFLQANQHPGVKLSSRVKTEKKNLAELKEEAERLAPEKEEKQFEFRFRDPGEIPGVILEMKNVCFAYDDMDGLLLENISLGIDMRSRIAMIGANGAGKTTLINLLIGKLQPISGEVVPNRHARVEVFTQRHIDSLNLEQTAVEYCLEKFEDDPLLIGAGSRKREFVRRRLGGFGLYGHEHEQQMKYLSGGQQSRVAFCVCCWYAPHILILDEPTNHLDMGTIDSVIRALRDYQGGVLVISHDQYFLAAVADEFWTLSRKGVENFSSFERAKRAALHPSRENVERPISREKP